MSGERAARPRGLKDPAAIVRKRRELSRSRRLALGLGAALLGPLPFVAPSARAAPSPWLERENPLLALLPSQDALAARERAHQEAALGRALRLLPGVDAAEVSLAPVAADPAPLDRALPAPRLAVVLRVQGPGPSDARVRALAADLMPAGANAELHVARVGTAPSRASAEVPTQPPLPGTIRVGPFWVAARSAPWLRHTLAACLLSNAALALFLLRRRWPRARQR